MTFFVLAAIAAVVIFIAAGFKKVDGNRGWKINAKQWLTIFALVLAIPAFFTVVPANSVGIVYSPFAGGVQDIVLEEGIQPKSPFDTVYLLSTEVQTSRLDNLHGQTKDAQFLTISIDVKYEVDKKQAVKVFQKFRSLDNVTASLVKPVAQRAIETATTRYNIIEILGEQRTDVYTQIESSLVERFASNGIALHSITFLDTDGGEAIEKAIRDEAVEKKAKETAVQRRDRALVEKETRITQAEAEAREKEILAAAIAENPEVLELEWIKKWNGVLPGFLSGDASGVMIDLSDSTLAPTPSATPAPTPAQ